MDIKRQGLRGLMKYILLPITLLSVAVLLSRCGQTPASVKPYKGASLVGEAIVSYDKASNNLTIQNFNAPDVTPATAGAGPTVSIWSVAAPTFNGSQVTGQVYIKNGSTSTLTGVDVVVDKAISGSVTVANPNYGNGFRQSNATQGPWTWWFYTGTSPNFNIPVGGQSNNVTWTFNATANFAVKVYVYAFCPSGVVMNRTATATGFANTPVSGAFVMLGSYPGDPNYITGEPIQGTNAVNYLPATDANGYFSLPIITVAGNYITYTVGAQGSGTVTTPQFDNFTLYGTGLNYVILPIRQSLEITSYIGAGTSAGAGNLTNPVNVLTGTCQNSYMQVGAFLPAMGFEDLINLSLSAIMGPDRNLSVIGGTGCGSSDLSTALSMPSNLIVPVQNDNNLTIYTNASGTTSGIYMNTMATTTQGKDFGIALPANTTGVAIGGIFGNLPNAQLTTLTQSMIATGNPVGLMGVLTTVSWLSFGYGGGLTTAGATINPLATSLDNISHSDSTYTFAAGNWANLNTIGGPLDPAGEYTGYNVIALPGLAVTTNGPLQQLTTESLPVGTASAPPATLQYVPANATGMPTGGVILPAAIVVDLNSLTANFSASTILADRTGYTTLPATLNQPFNQWYKLVDLQWPLINPVNQQIAWTDANNPGVSPNPPSLSYVAINYTQPKTYTDVYGATQTIGELALGWEILGAGPEAGNNMTGAIIPTLPAGTTGALLIQPTNQRFYTVNILQGRARTSINGPIYTWDSNNNIVYVAENDFLGSMDAFSLTKFHVGGGWIVSPANGAGTTGSPITVKALINAYNWSIVSQGSPSSLRGCITVQNNLTKAYVGNATCTGGMACGSLPAVTIAAPYASISASVALAGTGVYSAITFTPYNSTAAASVGGGPACQQVGDPTTIYVHQ
ncbi:MAG: hypothetical protein M1591_08785 [Deltaproteobacteria bacterium]|nr:hypothetical protein [Deltaproteobacteria bacterium]